MDRQTTGEGVSAPRPSSVDRVSGVSGGVAGRVTSVDSIGSGRPPSRDSTGGGGRVASVDSVAGGRPPSVENVIGGRQPSSDSVTNFFSPGCSDGRRPSGDDWSDQLRRLTAGSPPLPPGPPGSSGPRDLFSDGRQPSANDLRSPAAQSDRYATTDHRHPQTECRTFE